MRPGITIGGALMERNAIGIIGAGLAGLCCASILQKRGYTPVLLEKGRGVGGRLATRRTDAGFQFDHGAQYITARTPDFRNAVARLIGKGAAGTWSGADREVIVGTPSMNAMAKVLAGGLDIRRKTRVTDLRAEENGWRAATADSVFQFDRLVVTAPQPQTVGLLGVEHPLANAISAVRMSPCWTLMATFADQQEIPFTSRSAPDSYLAWIALNSSKPGRPDTNSWVVQASADWSARNLEREADDVAQEMLLRLCGILRIEPSNAVHASAHRWRYARVEEPLGTPFCRNDAGTLYLGGDWCLGARVEAAWTSGKAIADDLLGEIDAR
ncbi:NAD(P)/FAD-dependent oxidoreductase [Roseibium sp. MMSF_3412]|uniref:NAD(P)/FAD-dependent oxidoreductase n=1 Tax=Roseibium sp. MMSF_3412 TaxID=3046712 RepID=UPI00273F1078|nr:FAD-dependent oxidoreductase [Roseibium sp. MMSF_3412]